MLDPWSPSGAGSGNRGVVLSGGGLSSALFTSRPASRSSAASGGFGAEPVRDDASTVAGSVVEGGSACSPPPHGTQGGSVPTSSVACVTGSADGAHLVSGTANGWLWEWDVETGQATARVHAHGAPLRRVALEGRRGGQRVITAAADGSVRVHDLRARKPLVHSLRGHTDAVNALAALSERSALAAGSRDQTVRVWDLRTGRSLSTLREHLGGVHCLLRDGHGNLFSGARDASAKLWTSAGRCVRTLRRHRGTVSALALEPSAGTLRGRMLATGSSDATVALWDYVDGRSVRALRGHTAPVTSVAWPLDGFLVSASLDGTLRVWGCDQGSCLRRLVGHSQGVTAVRATRVPGGARVASASKDGTVRLWTLGESELADQARPRDAGRTRQRRPRASRRK